MTVIQAIQKRRAYRMLKPIEITDNIIEELGKAARLAPSCYNNQPWRFIFVRDKEVLNELYTALSEGNAWAKKSSLIIIVFGKKENDCVIKEREYYLFDIGLATAQLIMRATELNLVAHPIAGFSPEKVKQITGIPENNMVITILIVGKKLYKDKGESGQKQKDPEEKRPQRRGLAQLYSVNTYNKELSAMPTSN